MLNYVLYWIDRLGIWEMYYIIIDENEKKSIFCKYLYLQPSKRHFNRVQAG